MIKYLVAASEAGGIADATRRGWVRVAKDRFVTQKKDDIRLVWRFVQMIPAPDVTVFVKAADFPEDPYIRDIEATAFDEFVRCGQARWEC